jgi:hypothetical protein
MSAMLYELTASAAQMCSPVPAAAAGGWTEWLDHWQTLLGAAVGGVMGVAGAWIVAVSQRRRERRVAAGMVLPDLHQLTASGEMLERWLDRPDNVRGGTREVVAIDQLRRRRPIAFALHSSVIGQLSDIDARLYSHLFQCEMTHRSFEDGLAGSRASPNQPAAFDIPVPSNTRLYDDWQRTTEHATLAAYFLDRLVFSRWPRWAHRLRMRLSPNDLDRRSAQLISSGQPSPKTQTPPSAVDAAAQS